MLGEAYEVIRHRLPTKMAEAEAALQFRRSEIEPWSVEEAMAGLMIARVSHLELARKRSALLAVAQIVKNRPDIVAAPLSTLLSGWGADIRPAAINGASGGGGCAFCHQQRNQESA